MRNPPKKNRIILRERNKMTMKTNNLKAVVIILVLWVRHMMTTRGIFKTTVSASMILHHRLHIFNLCHSLQNDKLLIPLSWKIFSNNLIQRYNNQVYLDIIITIIVFHKYQLSTYFSSPCCLK